MASPRRTYGTFECSFDTGSVSTTMEGGNTSTHMEITYLGGLDL